MLRLEDPEVQYGSKSFFIREVDQRILPMIRLELVSCYYNMLVEGIIKLPDELRKLNDQIQNYEFKNELYRCIAEWYVETEIAIDTLRRI